VKIVWKFRLVFLILAILSLVIIIFLISSQRPLPESSKIMPKGYSNIYLGMSLHELRKKRPNIRFAPAGSMYLDGRWGGGYYENIGEDKIINSIAYSFKWHITISGKYGELFSIRPPGWDRLRKVEFRGGGHFHNAKKEISIFLNSSLYKWGPNYKIMVGKRGHDYDIVILFWEKDFANVVIWYDPLWTQEKRVKKSSKFIWEYNPGYTHEIIIYDPKRLNLKEVLSFSGLKMVEDKDNLKLSVNELKKFIMTDVHCGAF